MSDIHYIFQDGQTYAIRQGKVIASGQDPDQVERQVKQAYGPVPGQGTYAPGSAACPQCGGQIDPTTGQCVGCGYSDPVGQNFRDTMGEASGGPQGVALADRLKGMPPYQATVITPNGLKGTVLGKTAGVWGEEVTIRLENGRIVRLPVGTRLERPVSKTIAPVEQLERRLASTPVDVTREGLEVRYYELESIKRYASALVRDGANWDDSQRLDTITVTADVEQSQIQDAITAMDDAESYAPPGFSMGVADEAAGISREDASWLDDTVNSMIAEAEATDYGKLMDEGPEALTAEMADSAIGDREVTHGIASSFIREKTAGIDRKIANPYIQTFLARVEHCRRDELARRASEVPIHKEAAAEDPFKDFPDDAIFLT